MFRLTKHTQKNLAFLPQLPLIFAWLFTERTGDEDHPHKESIVSGPAHLHIRPEPPERTGELEETRSDAQEKSETHFPLEFCSSRVWGSNNQLICFQGAAAKKRAKKNKTKDTKETETSGEEEKKKAEEEGEDEEIPQLVPIDTPSKKPKLEVSAVHVY